MASLILLGVIPFLVALWHNRATSLFHALVWALIAWLGWGVAFLFDDSERASVASSRYVALCLTGCAGVAVLGARRPYVFAWNFVILGLLAVMVLPLVETKLLGTQSLDGLRIFFLTATIAVSILNYLPTRLALVAILLAAVIIGEVGDLYAPTLIRFREDLLLTLVPWLGWLMIRPSRHADRTEFDRLWLDFRDRWGLVWGQRVREQFNQAAGNAGWNATLSWGGLKDADALVEQENLVELLRATLQRFIGPS